MAAWLKSLPSSLTMTKQTLCMNPGPIEFEPSVLTEFAREGISHVDKQVIEVFGSCLEKMRKVFLSPDGQPLLVTGSGTLGWDMVACNLLVPGDNALVITTGYFGDHLGECLERYGAKVTYLRAPVGSQPSVDELSAILSAGVKYKMVTITHVDTSTGVLAHVEQFAAMIRKKQPNALIVVDGVCALGGEECRTKQWDLDVVLTGSQKCLGVPAGLSLLMIRPRALKAFEEASAASSSSSSGKSASSKYYCDWRNWLPIMKNYEARLPSYFATPAVNHLFALHKGLDILLGNGGMDKRFEEHQLISDAIKQAVQELGCSLVTFDGCGAHTLSCVRYPLGVGATDFLPKVYKRGVSLAGGLHHQIKTEYFRIGHMGPSTRRLDHAIKTIQAIEDALIECGHTVANKGAAVAKIKALQGQIPYYPASCCPLTAICCSDKCPVPPRCQFWTITTVVAAFALGFATSARLRA